MGVQVHTTTPTLLHPLEIYGDVNKTSTFKTKTETKTKTPDTRPQDMDQDSTPNKIIKLSTDTSVCADLRVHYLNELFH